MKKITKFLKLNLFGTLVLLFVVSSFTAYGQNTYEDWIQTTFTNTNNEVTVFLKPSNNINGLSFSSFSVSFRYLESYGIDFIVTESSYSPVTLIQQSLDPNDPSYRNYKFGFNNGSTIVNFIADNEYEIFKFQIVGGNENGVIGLIQDNTNYLWTPDYVFNNFTYYFTNYPTPFYGTLDNADFTLDGQNWFYRTSEVALFKHWLSAAASTDWNTGSNWSDGVVPVDGESVSIFAGTNQPIISTDVVLTNLFLEDNATVDIAYNGTLTVDGDVNIGIGNSFNIKSTSAGTGSFIHSTAGIEGAIQRHLVGWPEGEPLKNDFGWHLLSSPVAAQAIAPFQNLLDNDDFMKWNEVQNYWDNRRVGVSGLNGSFDTQFGIGTAYLVAYEGDKDFTFEGTINVADVEVGNPTLLTNSDPVAPGSTPYFGHHLLGNPFASALEWNNDNGDWGDLTANNIGGIVQIWDEDGPGYITLSENGIIPSMQGFFVYTPGNGSLTIPKAARVHSNQAYYKEAPQQILLTAHDLDHQMKQESKIRFNENASEGFDLQYDSYYMAGYAPQFYSVAGGAALAFNTLPAMTEDLVIPFTFVKNEGTNFQITLDAALDYGTVYLVDKKINVTENLSQTGSYSFVAAEGDDINRFLLKFGAVGIDDLVASEAAIAIFSAGDVLYLTAKQSGNAAVSVYDMLGRTVLTSEVQMTPSATIDVSGLSGTYIVRAIANGEVVSAKVFIK